MTLVPSHVPAGGTSAAPSSPDQVCPMGAGAGSARARWGWGDVLEIWPGSPYPLGANYDGGGTNFAIFSEIAERVELCLFDEKGRETRVELPEREALIWH